MTTSSIVRQLIGNTDEFPGVDRFACKDQKFLYSGVQVGAIVHNMA